MVPTAVILRIRSGRDSPERVRGSVRDPEQYTGVVGAADHRRQGVFRGQDRRHQAAGGRRHGRVLRRQARGRHQAQPQHGRGVQDLPPKARHPGQEHPGLHAGRAPRCRAAPSEHPRLPRGGSPQGFQ